MHLVFFLQAEDGIRDYKVTGVQTCALPISLPSGRLGLAAAHVICAALIVMAAWAGALYSVLARDPASQNVTQAALDRKSTRLNSSHLVISYAVFCLKKKKNESHDTLQPSRC